MTNLINVTFLWLNLGVFKYFWLVNYNRKYIKFQIILSINSKKIGYSFTALLKVHRFLGLNVVKMWLILAIVYKYFSKYCNLLSIHTFQTINNLIDLLTKHCLSGLGWLYLLNETHKWLNQGWFYFI